MFEKSQIKMSLLQRKHRVVLPYSPFPVSVFVNSNEVNSALYVKQEIAFFFVVKIHSYITECRKCYDLACFVQYFEKAGMRIFSNYSPKLK